ncbi:MAG: hypothetical protein V3T60_09550, partial [Candidatus Binatia bacterium]
MMRELPRVLNIIFLCLDWQKEGNKVGIPMSTRQRVSSLLLVFVALLSVFGSFSLGKALEGPGYYPGKLRIKKAKNLSREEREVEARFARYLE